MRAVIVGADLSAVFAETNIPHCVITPPAGLCHLPALLAENNIQQDKVLFFAQQELLGVRTFFTGLDAVPFPTLFWAIDSHLNMWWQKHYALLFDVVCTPHLSLFQALAKKYQPKNLFQLARRGINLPFTSHAQRKDFVNFVGIVNDYRPIRKNLCSLLNQHWGMKATQNVTSLQMLELYQNTRCLPNESIGLEVNFRIMEGASAGACVLSPDVGEDQNSLFTPDKEFLVYEDGLELLEKLTFLEKKPHLAEQIGKAAHTRVQKEHLVAFQHQLILKKIQNTAQSRLTDKEARKQLWLCCAQLNRNGNITLSATSILQKLAMIYEENLCEETLAALIFNTAELNKEALPALLASILGNNIHPDSFLVNMAAASSLLFYDNFEQSKAFWHRYAHDKKLALPKTPDQTALLWATECQKHGLLVSIGFLYEPHRICASAAIDFTLLAHRFAPESTEWCKIADDICVSVKGLNSMRLGFTAQLALHNQKDWRITTAFGALCLDTFKVQEGLAELQIALQLAQQAGQESYCLRMIKRLCGEHVANLLQKH